MESHKTLSVSAALAHLLSDGAPAAQVASEVVGAWRRVEASLNPIIGTGGVGALYKRSLWLASRSHTWMTELDGKIPGALDLEALTEALLVQKSTDAALGGGEHLQTFCDLLVELIGSTLTHKLLSDLWESFDELNLRSRHG